ncbi:Probable DEAD-box ATP-dependent RNA helicase 48 [Linum grandiflorum]
MARTSDLLHARFSARLAGGESYTFPGCLNNWFLRKKKAWKEEKRQLHQAQQLHQGQLNTGSDSSTSSNSITLEGHISALADYFNQDAKPLLVRIATLKQGSVSSTCRFNFSKSRDFSTTRSLVLDSKDDSRKSLTQKRRVKYRRSDTSSSDDDVENDDYGESTPEGLVSGGKSTRGRDISSLAALRNHEVKVRKRVPLKKIEEELDFAKELQLIRNKIGKNKMVEKLGKSDIAKEVESSLGEKRFDESGLSSLTIRAMEAIGHLRMTKVQEATLSACLDGNDAMIKARTGTGKTAAFLFPAIEAVLKAASTSSEQRVHQINVIILCPTRDVASQITAEAVAILRFHDGIGVQSLVGGTRFKDDLRRLESDPCQIIVATPGRLLDHIENKGGLSVHLVGLKMLILDEADHLLDLGFRKDLEKIVDSLPRRRQTLLFSATIPKEVRRISQLVLKKDHAFIDTVGLGTVETPIKVRQSVLVVPHELHFLVVHHLLKEHMMQIPDYKVIVFCTTGAVTSLMYLILREMKMNVREMHSRKLPLHRSRVSDEFKESKRLILVTSDIPAEGVDYPDVSLVIQVGIPCDREHYMKRVGITGREGKDGEGMLIVAPWEEYFLKELKEVPLEKGPAPDIKPEVKLKMENKLTQVDKSSKEAAYHAWLGYYNSIREIGTDKTALVELANGFCESIGLRKPPSISRKTALQMGVKDIPGIHIRY